jgi:D-alanyl-D-alanine carboxypeptidase/D-alanyl-D-alanine-endopeptidase (penicillin-binding protein 4)
VKRALLLLLALALVAAPAAGAGPRKLATRPQKGAAPKPIETAVATAKKAVAKPADPKTPAGPKKRDPKAKAPTRGAARVAFSVAGEMRPAREVVGRKEEPLTLEESVAKNIEKVLRGPLRRGITGVYVADAKTGEPLFAVNADDPLNPASNVKMISTATALELLGPTFRYSTRVLGREPDTSGVIKGDVYLLGTWDPTLGQSDMENLAAQIAKRGVTKLEGDVLVGSDPTRDGMYRAMVPIKIVAGEPGQPPTATAPTGFDFVEIEMKAKTEKRARKKHKLKFSASTIQNADGKKRIKLTITGLIGKAGEKTYNLYTRERTWMASHALRAALRSNKITVTGDVRSVELGDYIGDAVGAAGLPIELARHDSDQLQDIVRRINKWSVNWLADRVIMTAAALARRTTPSMQVAVEAMYDWMQRHPQLNKDNVVIDTGSGLSYRTRITPAEIVKVVRAAGGFAPGGDVDQSKAWLESLSIGGTDGTLRSRFRVNDLRGHLRGKTGSLSTVIALAGVLELDPTRPLAFAIVTNTPTRLRKGYVRKAHEQLVTLLAEYVTQTAKPTSMPAGTPVKVGEPVSTPAPEFDENTPTPPEEIAEPQPDPELDYEAAEKENEAPKSEAAEPAP